MQSDLNNETYSTLFNQRRKNTRDRTRIDFIQNTVVEGTWNFDQAVLNNELPELVVQHCTQRMGQPTNDYGEVAEITFNGTDRNDKNSLAETRKGATLIIFDVILNLLLSLLLMMSPLLVALRVVSSLVTFHVRVAFGRNVGLVPDDAPCEIQIVSYP